MIEYLASSTPTCFVVKMSGKLGGAEYKELIGKIENAIRENGSANLVYVMQSLEFPEWDAIKADAHFGSKDYRHIHRAAFVGDEKWLEWFVKLAGPFTRAEEKHFSHDQLSEAVQWACN